MALRFFLMSAVASLGLSLPEEKDVREWTVAAQTWTNARLAQWDARCAEAGGVAALAARRERSEPKPSAPGDLGFDAAVEEMVRLFSTEGPAAPAREGRAVTLATSTFEPMVIGEDLYTGAAYALNRASEGTDLSGLVIAERAAPAGWTSMATAVGNDSAVTQSWKQGECVRSRCLEGEASGPGEGDSDPMVVGDDLYTGVAYSLNRASEGLGLASEGSTLHAPVVDPQVSRLSVALRLTREAVYAWSNLLHGPAVVAISR